MLGEKLREEQAGVWLSCPGRMDNGVSPGTGLFGDQVSRGSAAPGSRWIEGCAQSKCGLRCTSGSQHFFWGVKSPTQNFPEQGRNNNIPSV